jgi:hypothetical protein
MKVIFEEDDWEPLVETHRCELQESGALYKILNNQRNCLLSRELERVKEIEVCIDEQTLKTTLARKKRDESVDELIAKAGIAHNTPLLKMLPYFPEFSRPLLEALAIESHQMIIKIRWRARQNRLLQESLASRSTKRATSIQKRDAS